MAEYKKMWYCAIFLILDISRVYCSFFNEEDVTRFNLGDTERNDTYFGYTVLLQNGSDPQVIVGAPNADPEEGGGLYSCTLDTKCRKYELNAVNEVISRNFLGSSLDGRNATGGEIIVCAPRSPSLPVQKGICFYLANSTDLSGKQTVEFNPIQAEKNTFEAEPGRKEYDYGLAQAGFAVHFTKDNVLLGAPGVRMMSGIVIEQKLKESKKYSVKHRKIRKRTRLTNDDLYGYLGYSVTSGYFMENAREPYQVVAGAPRARNLFGTVNIFSGDSSIGMYESYEYGTYYGATVLALDVNNDGLDELFVGAPFLKGSTYDEGCVIVYADKFSSYYELYGSRKIAARFGSAMASLGDIDRDTFKDVAISAPYEDDGVGAVYIYLGSANGIQTTYSQRLTPLSFKGGSQATRGFGLGMSRGNDIDGNGHNDLAVGAYQSGEVFLFKSRTVIDYELVLKANVSTFTSNDTIKVSYCVQYTQRSSSKEQGSVEFNIKLHLDYRTVGKRVFEENSTINLGNHCQHKNVTITDIVNLNDISPYMMSMKAECLSNIIAYGQNNIEAAVPYAHGCGTDNICQTNITLSATTSLSTIIIDQNSEINVTITAKNTGDPGLYCKLTITPPGTFELIQSSMCEIRSAIYVCPFASNLTEAKENTYTFAVGRLNPATRLVRINFTINCLGDNFVKSNTSTDIKVALHNSPFIEGISESQKKYFFRTQPEDLNVTHLFIVGNAGPSPVKLDLFIILPIVQHQNKDIFDFFQVTKHGLKRSDCSLSNNTALVEHILETKKLTKESFNETVVYDSIDGSDKYTVIFCQGNYLPKSSEEERYEVTFTVKGQLLSEIYEKERLEEKAVAYISRAFLVEDTDSSIFAAHSVTTIQPSGYNPNLMKYIIVGVVLGIILLALLIYFLYKGHFFERSLRDKMYDENSMTTDVLGQSCFQYQENPVIRNPTEDVQNTTHVDVHAVGPTGLISGHDGHKGSTDSVSDSIHGGHHNSSDLISHSIHSGHHNSSDLISDSSNSHHNSTDFTSASQDYSGQDDSTVSVSNETDL